MIHFAKKKKKKKLADYLLPFDLHIYCCKLPKATNILHLNCNLTAIKLTAKN
jgi:hypothetical protein